MIRLCVLWILCMTYVFYAPQIYAVVAPDTAVHIDDLKVTGLLKGETIGFTIDCTFRADVSQIRSQAKTSPLSFVLIAGDAVLTDTTSSRLMPQGTRLIFDDGESAYKIVIDAQGEHKGTFTVQLSFAVRPRAHAQLMVRKHLGTDKKWRHYIFELPQATQRQLEIRSARSDIELDFPGALNLQRSTEDAQTVFRALLGPSHAFHVRWQPQVSKLDGKLLVASRSNIIVRAQTGVWHIDSVHDFEITQGAMKKCVLHVPAGVQITSVQGLYIRDWDIRSAGDHQIVQVQLNRDITDRYVVHVKGERSLGALPVTERVPRIYPLATMHNRGHILIGSNAAVQLTPHTFIGVKQIDTSSFPRMQAQGVRSLPRVPLYAYEFSSDQWLVDMSIQEIVPSFDVEQRVQVSLHDDDIIIDNTIEVDIRDSAIRQLQLQLPVGFTLAELSGKHVDSDASHVQGTGKNRTLHIVFTKAIIGRSTIQCRLEYGKSPLGQVVEMSGLAVTAARNERGFVVVRVEDGVQIAKTEIQELRQVHIGSLPMRVHEAQFAWRFRSPNWRLQLHAQKRSAGIRAEAFHLLSLGDGTAYGSVIVTYFITGAPVDELYFRVKKDAGMKQLEFIGNDISSWEALAVNDHTQEYRVKLNRKVIGDYNLGVYWQQRYQESSQVHVGIIECTRVDVETGYIVLASRDNVRVQAPSDMPLSLLEIDSEELPASYRLPINAPILQTYKYLQGTHAVKLTVNSLQQGTLVPVVIEVMELETTISVREDTAAVESLTTVIYKVKNASSQFLSIMMPDDARIWSIHALGGVNGINGENKKTLTAAQDGSMVKIPLERRRDPNTVMTIQLVYGQSHGILDWDGALALQAPQSDLHSTFSRWQIQVPDGLMVTATGIANMEVVSNKAVAVATLFQRIRRAWQQTVSGIVKSNDFAILLAVLAVAMTVGFFYKRPWLPRIAVIFVCAFCIYAGVHSSQSVAMPQVQVPQQIAFDQALSLDLHQPMKVVLAVQEDWRFMLQQSTAIIAAICMLAALTLVWFLRRNRMIKIIGLSLAALCMGITMQSVPALHMLCIHICTWVVPIFFTLFFARHLLLRLWKQCMHSGIHKTQQAAAAVFLACCLFSCTSNSARTGIDDVAVGTIAHIDVQAHVGDDSVAVQLLFAVNVENVENVGKMGKNYILPIAPLAAVLRNIEDLPDNVHIQLGAEQYEMNFSKEGTYDIALHYLLPLPEKERTRSFAVPMPMALANTVQLHIPQSGMSILADSAIGVSSAEHAKSTVATAYFAPGEDAEFSWQARSRNTRDEATRMYAEIIHIARSDSGIIEGTHGIQLRIAQGEIRDLRLRIPEGMTVTVVEGIDIGAWRYDQETGFCDIKLINAHSGDYFLRVQTQMSALSVPYEVNIAGIIVESAERNRSLLGISASAAVIVSPVSDTKSAMHIDDFTNQVESMMHSAALSAGTTTEGTSLLGTGTRLSTGKKVRFAFRLDQQHQSIAIQVQEVLPEIRSIENTSFSVSDERLVYSGHIETTVSKSGIFALELELPQGFDIDSLSCPQMSHWDELANSAHADNRQGKRHIQIFLKNKTIGTITIGIALSKSLQSMPQQMTVPRISVLKSLKHKGQVILSAERGLRLHVVNKKGVSEVEERTREQRRHKALRFRLLQKDWTIQIQAQIIRAVSNVQFLHDVHVAEGMLRHNWYLRHQMRNAGRKHFRVQIPMAAMGVSIDAPDVARWDDVQENGQRFIEVTLTKKYFEQTWPLRLNFETRYERSQGKIRLQGLGVSNSDSLKGHIVIHGSDRVEIELQGSAHELVATEARSIANIFGAGSLADAAFCFKSGNGIYELSLQATRHARADVLQAQVLTTQIDTVFTERGESFNRMQMTLRVGKKRYIEATLPAASEIWSLRVDGVVSAPSKKDASTWLIPVARGTVGNLPVTIELVYVCIQGAAWNNGPQKLTGPQFDLPLVDINWNIYVPQTWDYNDINGTLSVRADSLRAAVNCVYGIQAYEQQNDRVNKKDLARARQLQAAGNKLAQQGKQYAAKQALEMAWNYSYSDAGFNEDARVQLHALNNRQAVVSFVSRRGNVRQQPGEWDNNSNANGNVDLGDNYRQDDALRVQNSLSKDDSQNLEKIIGNMIRMQEDAATTAPRMMITAPLHGRLLRFHRSLQVEANAEMYVSFQAEKKQATSTHSAQETSIASISLWTLALACALSALFFIESQWQKISDLFQTPIQEHKEVEAVTAAIEETPSTTTPLPASADKELIANDEWQALVEEESEADEQQADDNEDV